MREILDLWDIPRYRRRAVTLAGAIILFVAFIIIGGIVQHAHECWLITRKEKKSGL